MLGHASCMLGWLHVLPVARKQETFTQCRITPVAPGPDYIRVYIFFLAHYLLNMLKIKRDIN